MPSSAAYKWLLVGEIRQVWTKYSPERKAALLDARREFHRFNKDGSLSKRVWVCYQCADCGVLTDGEGREVDHIKPIGSAPPWPIQSEADLRAWGKYIDDVNCSKDNLQILCRPCHQKKTNKENKERRMS